MITQSAQAPPSSWQPSTNVNAGLHPLWAAGITGAGQVIGCGDSGVGACRGGAGRGRAGSGPTARCAGARPSSSSSTPQGPFLPSERWPPELRRSQQRTACASSKQNQSPPRPRRLLAQTGGTASSWTPASATPPGAPRCPMSTASKPSPAPTAARSCEGTSMGAGARSSRIQGPSCSWRVGEARGQQAGGGVCCACLWWRRAGALPGPASVGSPDALWCEGPEPYL